MESIKIVDIFLILLGNFMVIHHLFLQKLFDFANMLHYEFLKPNFYSGNHANGGCTSQQSGRGANEDKRSASSGTVIAMRIDEIFAEEASRRRLKGVKVGEARTPFSSLGLKNVDKSLILVYLILVYLCQEFSSSTIVKLGTPELWLRLLPKA